MPGRAEPPRNLGAMRDVQTQRKTPRRSSEFLKNIDAVLREVDDSDAAHEARKTKNEAEIEKIFPGVRLDEKTASGMYEPSARHYQSGKPVMFYRRHDVKEIPEFPSEILTSDQQRNMFPPTADHLIYGTGNPLSIYPTHTSQQIVSDSDLHTPDFGTERDERDYAGFEAFTKKTPWKIDSEAYWSQLDQYSRTNIRKRHEAEQQTRERRTRALPSTSDRAPRRSRDPQAGPVRDTRGAAELMAQGQPARAGGREREAGRHSFRGRAQSAGSDTIGRLPNNLEPGRRNLQTDFTVYSYNTPIAWRTTSGHWEVPRIKYSRTTQRHQSAIRSALSNTHHSPIAEASYRVYDLRQTHREQGINLPSTKYELNVGFETFHPEPPSEETVNAIVQDHLQQVINPAIERRRNSRNFQRQRTQPQLPLEGGIA